MDTISLLGYSATFLSSVGLFPQVVKAMKSKSTDDFSLSMLFVSTLASTTWLLYGISLKEFPIILANAIVLSCWSIIFIYKLKYK